MGIFAEGNQVSPPSGCNWIVWNESVVGTSASSWNTRFAAHGCTCRYCRMVDKSPIRIQLAKVSGLADEHGRFHPHPLVRSDSHHCNTLCSKLHIQQRLTADL